jgi:hypothetical protein
MKLDEQEDGFQIDTLARLPKTLVAFDAYRTTGYASSGIQDSMKLFGTKDSKCRLEEE